MEITQQQINIVVHYNSNVNTIIREIEQGLKEHEGKRLFKNSGFLSKNTEYLNQLIGGYSSKIIKVDDKKLNFRYRLFKEGKVIKLEFEMHTGHPSTHRTNCFYLGKLNDDYKIITLYPPIPLLPVEFDLSYLRQVQRSVFDLEKQVHKLKKELRYFL